MPKKLSITELGDAIGKHEFEIIDVSTEWCGPCHGLKKAMKKVLKGKKFENVDLEVYYIDGDECSEYEQNIDLVNKSLSDGLTYPIPRSEFIKWLHETINQENLYDKDEMDQILDQITSSQFFERENGHINISENIEDLKKIVNPMIEFQVDGFPTLILFRNGKPIEKSVVEDDYQSRGFYIYDEKDHGEIKDAVIEEVEYEGEITKIIQLNKKLDARIVGFGEKKDLEKQLSTFITS